MVLQMSRRLTAGLAVGTGVLIVGVGAVVSAGGASAAPKSAIAVVNTAGSKLSYTAASGQKNALAIAMSVASDGSTISYRLDDRVPIAAGHGCKHPDSTDQTLVVCGIVVPQDDPANDIEYTDFASIKLGDKNDSVKFTNATKKVRQGTDVYLGAGNDTYTTAKGAIDLNLVQGQAGNDTLTASDATSVKGLRLNGDAGNDVIRISGKGSVFAYGGAGADKLYGGSGNDFLWGGPGNDRLQGNAGNDYLAGQTGNDTLYGNKGNDKILGNAGNDKLYGGPGTDQLVGGQGKNVIVQD